MGRYLDVGRKGVSFQDVVRQIRSYYISKGYSYEEADRIARATAGKVFWRKFGHTKGAQIIRQAKARAKRRHR